MGEGLKRVGQQILTAGRDRGGEGRGMSSRGVLLEAKDSCSLGCGPFKLQPVPPTASPSPETY